MRPVAAVVVSLALFATGCETHYAMTEPRGPLLAGAMADSPAEAARAEKAISDGDIGKLLEADVHAKLPTALAIAKVGPSGNRYYNAGGIETVGAEELKSWEKVVASEPRIKGVQPIVPLSVSRPKDSDPVTMRSLREAAARQNCELLLVYAQDDADIQNLNNASVLYWTIIGCFVVPGTDVEHRTVMQAVLVDSRTGNVLGTATGEDHPKRTTAAAWTDLEHDKMTRQTSEKSLKDLQTGVGKLLHEVVAASPVASR